MDKQTITTAADTQYSHFVALNLTAFIIAFFRFEAILRALGMIYGRKGIRLKLSK